MRRIIVTSQDILNPENTVEKIYEYDLNEKDCLDKSLQDFGVDPEKIVECTILLDTLDSGHNIEVRAITLRSCTNIIITKEILI